MANPDELTIAMQNEAIRISEERLGKSLRPELISNICRSWSYMGLEVIIDTVSTIEIDGLEGYLAGLNN